MFDEKALQSARRYEKPISMKQKKMEAKGSSMQPCVESEIIYY
jgi:hypothetical protein